MHFFVDKTWPICDNVYMMRNKETNMKEKKTFAWDTIMTLSLTSNKMTVHGTDIEVKWCPITKMWWEV